MTALGTPLLLLALAAADPPPKPALPDYEAMLNDRLGKGITPERNANVLIWKALGPRPEGGKGMPPEYFKRLGVPEPPKDGDYFVGFTAFTRDRLKLTGEELAAFNDQISRVTKRPWATKEFPRHAAWLVLNEKPLAVVIEAVKRPDYYNPILSRKDRTGDGSLIGALMPSVQKSREIASALCARAMLRVAEGKFDDAWADLLAAHRLARLVGRGGTLIEGLVGYYIDALASEAELAYLEAAPLTGKQVLARLRDLQALPPVSPMADKIDVAGRYVCLDALLNLTRRGVVNELAGDGGKLSPEEIKALAALDWAPVVKNITAFYDRMAAALRLKTRTERQAACARIQADLEALARAAGNSKNVLKDVLLGKDPGKDVAKGIGDVLLGLMAPAIGRVQDAYDRVEQFRLNQLVAFALAAYRADHNKYPDKLDDLAPAYLKAVPGDLFSGKPLVYRPDAKGYLLYSVGVNGQDDGGRWRDDDPPGDDLRIRMPLPPLK